MTNTKTTILTAVLLLGSFMGATQAATLKSAPVKPSAPGVIAAPSGGAWTLGRTAAAVVLEQPPLLPASWC